MSDILLAKSEPQISLKQHTQDGLDVWKQLQISFPLAPIVSQKDNFWWLLRLAVITHDLGKAHEEFQKILKGEDNKWNRQRHELFSLPFTNQLPLDDTDKLFVLRVVAGHHRSYQVLRKIIRDNYEIDPNEFSEEFTKVDIRGAIKIANELEEGLLPEEVPIIHPKSLVVDYQKDVRLASRKLNDQKEEFFFQLLLMGAFHQCDHLSSGFITEFPNLTNESFQFLDRMELDLMSRNLKFYPHQQQVSEILSNVILTAPTGSGKTETAMIWLKKQLITVGQGRVFYVLPFTASINAMFERLGNNEDGLGADMVGMLHGKLNAYLYESFFSDAGNLQTLKSQIKSVREQFKNLQTPLKVLTPFQLLKHIFGLKGFEKGIFEWVGGHFIFDEIHAYDPKVTAQIIVLLEFLVQKLDAKIFIMTATLPSFLKDLIKKSLSNKYTEIQADEQLYRSFQRHKLSLEEGLLTDSFTKIEHFLGQNQSVLVVCNTVDASRDVYNYFEKKYDALLLHGRFAAKDRNRIEKALRDNPPQLLIGTQAIEVSLDIDYDMIFTEPAPLDALIQRFGRVNRKRSKKPCTCFVYKERGPKDKFVYTDEELISRTLNVLEVIQAKNGGVIQEIELQKYIDEVYPDFSKKAKEEFDKVYENLKIHLKTLFPFDPSPEGEDAYYKQFDGVKVIPAFYENEYKKLLDQFDFIGAEQLKVSIRSSRFGQFINTTDLESLKIAIANPERKDSEPIEIEYYKLNKKYNPKTGLDFNLDEDIKIVSQSSFVIDP